jgi:hypothetical protein
LQGVSRLETTDIEQFMLHVGQLLAARKSQHLNAKETQLLKAINQSVPSHYLEEYQIFVEKSENNSINEAENEAFLALHSKIQQLNAKRYKKIAALAQLRQVSVPVIMQQYNLYSNVKIFANCG